MRNNKGVTLVALVVTIVVLLILVSVSVGYISKSNGIVEKSSEAIKKENEYEQKQQNSIGKLYEQLNEKPSTDPIEVVNKIEGGDSGNVDNTEDGKWPYVPDGFKVIAGKDNGLEGFTITDAPNGQEGQGNEFVFIPVLNIDIFKEDKTYREDGDGTKTRFYDDETDSEYKKMLESVEKNKGFYIGRYEISLDSNGTARNKYLMNPAYNIAKGNAQTACEKYATEYNNYYTESKKISTGLLWGKNWDAVLRFLDGKRTEKGVILDQAKLTQDSSEWGNYYNQTGYTIRGLHGYEKNSDIDWYYDGTVKKQGNKGQTSYLQAGASDRNKVKNIYDFAGNFKEWTREKTDSSLHHVYRGGSAMNYGGVLGKNTALNRTESDGNGAIDISARMLMFRIEE